MKSYKIIKNQLLKNKSIKKSYNELGLEFELIQLILEKRLQKENL